MSEEPNTNKQETELTPTVRETKVTGQLGENQLEDVAGGAGGGIYNRDTLTLSNSTITGNSAADQSSLQIAQKEDDRNA